MFTIEDNNKPMQFYTNCTGCILVPQKRDQVMIVTATGEHVPVAVQMPHALSTILFKKIIEASKRDGAVEIPNMMEMSEDEIRQALDELQVIDL